MKFRNSVIFLIIFIVSCISETTEGNNLSEIGFYSSPDKIISLMDKNAVSYREHFMLGIAHNKKGNLKNAIFHFSNSCFKYHRNNSLKLFPAPVYAFISGFHIKSEYYNDAVAGIAEAFFQYKEHEYVIKFTKLIGRDDAALYRDSMLLKAKANAELGRYDEAIKDLSSLHKIYKDNDSRSVIGIRMASIFEKKADNLRALREYFTVINLDASSWQSASAAGRILELMNKNTENLSASEKLSLGKTLYCIARYPEAIDNLKKAFDGTKEKNEKELALQYLIKSYSRSGKMQEADTVVARAKELNIPAYVFLKLKADELWAAKKKALAVNTYMLLEKNTTKDIEKDSAKKIALFLEERNSQGFEKYLIDYKNKYKDDACSEYFLWVLGRESIKKNNNVAAILFLEEGLSGFQPGEYSDRMRFWLYKLYELQNNKSKSEKKFRELVAFNPDSTYTWTLLQQKMSAFKAENLEKEFNRSLAKKDREGYLFSHMMLFLLEKDIKKRDSRLSLIPAFEKAQGEALEKSINKLDMASEYSKNFKQIEKYFVIGYNDGIARELSIIPDEDKFKKEKNIALSYYGYFYAQSYYSLYGVVEILKQNKIRENIALLPFSVIKRILPAPFKECVNESGAEFNIEKSLIYGVMKAETIFNHKAVSSAGAVGLMQLMPGTAKGIARDLKIKEFDLKDPCISIRFGTEYLSWLKKFFNGNLDYMLAGYNAGAGNVKKWQKTLNAKDSDYFTEFIPFDETRYYIYRIRKFLYQYRLFNR